MATSFIYFLSLWTWLPQGPRISGVGQYISFGNWHISLSIKSLRFIHAAVCCQNLLPFKGWIMFHCVDGPHFILSSVNKHLSGFHLWLRPANEQGCANISSRRCFQFLCCLKSLEARWAETSQNASFRKTQVKKRMQFCACMKAFKHLILIQERYGREIKPVNPKGNQLWTFTGRTDAEAEAPILRSPDSKNQLIGKDPDAGKDWGQEEKGATEDEMVGWHHWLNGHEFEQTSGENEGQGSIACCSPWGLKDSDTT